MIKNNAKQSDRTPKWLAAFICLLMIVGMGIFIVNIIAGDRTKAWQAYLINFLLFSSIAHGAVLFSALMHAVKAKWSGPLADLAESFSAFFPISFILLLLLYFGKGYVFPWLFDNLHGKEVWLNLPFLLTRDAVGLLILYGLGFAYLYHALYFKLKKRGASSTIGKRLWNRWQTKPPDIDRFKGRMTRFALLYMLAFAFVLSLLGYDLVMSTDPHWYSTLFGTYSFIKTVYVDFGTLIITAALLHMSSTNRFELESSQFHDIGKLFFAFCLVWADFFYAQFVVIWYGNISEETAYIIERTMSAPWRSLAWIVFGVCFIGPFLILINKKIKTIPAAMVVICSLVVVGMWLEHFLLLAPALYPYAKTLPLGWIDLGVALGFLGLLMAAVTLYIEQFPELLHVRAEEGR